MPKKHTAADEAFISKFAAQLRNAYENRSNDISRADFAKSIGINSSSLKELLDGIRMPGVPTLALAVHHYNLDLDYAGTKVGPPGIRIPSSNSLRLLLFMPIDLAKS